MASISFRVRSKANKNAAIKIRVSIDRQNVFETNTGFSIHPKNWSSETGLPKQTTAENKQIQSNLKKLDAFVWENLNADSGGSVIIDQFWLEEKIAACFSRIEKNDNGLLVNYLEELIKNANSRKVKIPGGHKKGISQSRINSFVSTKNKLIEFQSVIKKQIHFIDLSETLVEQLTHWLFEIKCYAIATGSKDLANIKTVSREADRKGIPTHPYAKYIEVFSEADEDRYIQTLSFEEQRLILDADIQREALNNARKWLLLGCEIGQRGQDLLKIQQSEIRKKNGRFYYDLIQGKGKKDVTIPIIAPHLINIIENAYPYKISMQKLNEYIKEVCKIAGITAPSEGRLPNPKTRRKELGIYEKYRLVTAHSFRRSFATNYYGKMPTQLIMAITAHSRESIFLKYINQRQNKDDIADMFTKYHEEIHKISEPQLRIVKTGT